MHACLNVDEILRLIAHELVTSEGEATAIALACCCKNFEDPVLDVLWVVQDGLLPLLKAFPEDVWNDDECTVSGPATRVFHFFNNSIRKSFKRLPTTTEWSRFRKYTRRMRELNEDYAPKPEDLPLETLSALKFCTTNEPLLPNLKTLDLRVVHRLFVPFIPFFLSPRVTSLSLGFLPNCPKTTVASTISNFPTLCPHLQKISLNFLLSDPMITAVSGMVLAINRNTLQQFHVDPPLTEEASEVVYQLPNLRDLSVTIKRETSLPSASLPNLTKLLIRCNDESDWPRLFHGATFGKLESVMFFPQSSEIGDFLGAFKRAALSSSVQNTLSAFYLSTSYSWNPSYSSLLPFTQLVDLDIELSCRDGCSSRVDDDIVIDLSRAMPKLTALKLGDNPCWGPTTGVTAKGLVALALHCPDLRHLCIHFQVASLSAPPTSPGTARNVKPTGSWTDCALAELTAGETQVPEESVLMVAQTLLRIFPGIWFIDATGEGWPEVIDAIRLSR